MPTKKEAIKMTEEHFLNTGRVLSDAELLNLSEPMNRYYKQLMKMDIEEVQVLAMTKFEKALERIENELKEEGYTDSYLDQKLYKAELETRLLKWAKEYRRLSNPQI